MAIQEQLSLLQQGTEIWNKWRALHQQIFIDLSGANLSMANLSMANLSGANLSGANLSGANLSGANLSMAYLYGTELTIANLSYADLSHANLSEANLNKANLSYANLINIEISRAYINGANLNKADLSYARVEMVTFGNLDLSTTKGLETIMHLSPSTIGVDTIYKSHGKIPDAFLRGAGVQASFIENIAALTNRPIEYYTCFLSYSSKDQQLAERLYADLQHNGVRCWFAPEDLKIGDKFRARIDESIRLYDKLLLVLSEYAIASDWVEYEIEAAFAKERREKRIVLFPVRLDNTVMKSTTAWAAHIQGTRHIGNFERWKDHDAYIKAFDRLLRDLKADAAKDAH